MNIKISSNADEVAKDLGNSLADYKKQLKFQVFRALSLLEAEIKQNLRKGSGLKVRTGALLNSITASKRVYEDGGLIYGEIGPEGIPYARIHEEGGTITAKKGSLTIPSSQNRRADGLPMMSISDVFNSKKSFTAKGTVFMKDGTSIKPMFFLRKSVNIPKRPYLSTALAAKKDQILNDFGLFLSVTFKTEK